MMGALFKLNERGTSVRTEFIAGMTTFFAMVYILMVNANMFANPFGDGSNPLGVSYGAIYIATAISAIVGTVLAGLLANLSLAQASGRGMYYLLGLTVDGFYASLQITFISPFKAFGEFASLSLFQVLKSGFDFSAYTALHGSTNLVLTMTVMPFTYNISYGIAFGLISYIVISIFCGDSRKIKDSSWVVALLFVAMLLLTH